MEGYSLSMLLHSTFLYPNESAALPKPSYSVKLKTVLAFELSSERRWPRTSCFIQVSRCARQGNPSYRRALTENPELVGIEVLIKRATVRIPSRPSRYVS